MILVNFCPRRTCNSLMTCERGVSHLVPRNRRERKRAMWIAREQHRDSERSLRRRPPDDSYSRQNLREMLAGVFPSPSALLSPLMSATEPTHRPIRRRLHRRATTAIGWHRMSSYRAGVGGPRLAEAEVTVPFSAGKR